MQNGSGNQPDRSTQPAPYGTPEGDLVVYAGTHQHRYASPLNQLPDGTHVIAAGMVQETREHGSMDAPRATFHLITELGTGAYAAVSTDVLIAYSLYLLDGIEICAEGVCRRPFADGPPYIQVIKVEPITD